jgi:hypothetical protein
MKSVKNIAVFLLAAMLVGCLAGCKTTVPEVMEPVIHTTEPTTVTIEPTISGSEENNDDVTQPTEPVTEPTTEPTEEPTTQPGTEPSEPGDAVCAHKWSSWETQAATCTENGSKSRTCASCGQEERETVNATGHSIGSWEITKAATCEAAGTKSGKCVACGKNVTETVAAKGHAWDGGKVTVQPTSCSDKGSKSFTCKTCGKTKTDVINGNHAFGEWKYEEYTYIIKEDPNNPHDGYEDWVVTSHRKARSCTKCGLKETGNTPDHPCKRGSVNHKVTTVKEGTCLVKSVKRSTCKICGWYVDYEYDDRRSRHTWISEERHLTDYTETTDELDVEIITCTTCHDVEYYYRWGKGPCICGRTPCVAKDNWRGCISHCRDFLMYGDYSISIRSRGTLIQPDGIHTTGIGDCYYVNEDVNPDGYILHPTWQTVVRDYVFNEQGRIVQFTVKWHDVNGNSFSKVVYVPDVPQLFWDAGFDKEEYDPSRITMHLTPYMGTLIPTTITWSG